MGIKKQILMGMSIGTLILVGCEDATNDTQVEEGDSSDQLAEGEVEELFQQAIENNEEIESFVNTFTQEIIGEMDGDESEMYTEMEIELASVDNMRVFMDINMAIGDELDESMSMEMILVDNVVYYDLGDGTWHQDENMMDSSEFEGMEEELTGHHFNELLEYSEHVTVYDENDTYRVVMYLEGEDAQSFSAQVDGQSDVLGDQTTSDLEHMGIYDLEYELILDKETLWMTEFTMNMAADGETEGFTLEADIVMQGTFYDYNQVERIEAPE